MGNIEMRLRALEQQQGNAPMLVLFVGDRPTAEQLAEIDTAIMTGRMLVVFVAHGDTAWITDAVNPPPWEMDIPPFMPTKKGDHYA